MSPHGRVHGAPQRAGTPCRRGSFGSYRQESTFFDIKLELRANLRGFAPHMGLA
jgi:hypothetical protein